MVKYKYMKKIIQLVFILFMFLFNSCGFVDDQKTYSARYAGDKSYTITWLDGNADIIYSERVKQGELPTYSVDYIPRKNDSAESKYKFNGKWEPEIVPASKDASYYAQFDSTKRNYSITWYVAGIEYNKESFKFGEMPKLNMADPNNYNETDRNTDIIYRYKFVGWEPEYRPVTSDFSYYAKFEKTPLTSLYKLTFDFDNGEENIVRYLKYNDTIEFPGNPKKDGYIFSKWDNSTLSKMPMYDVVIKAIYVPYDGLVFNLSGKIKEYNFSACRNYNLIMISNGEITQVKTICDAISLTNNAIHEAKLYVPTSITKVADSAFNGLNYITEIYFAGNVTSIGTKAFNNCPNLRKVVFNGKGNITFANGNLNFGSQNNKYYDTNISYDNLNNASATINFASFHMCYSLNEIIFNNEQVNFSNIILGCMVTSVTKIRLPNTLKKLYLFNSFNNTTSTNSLIRSQKMALTDIFIPKSVTEFYFFYHSVFDVNVTTPPNTNPVPNLNIRYEDDRTEFDKIVYYAYQEENGNFIYNSSNTAPNFLSIEVNSSR